MCIGADLLDQNILKKSLFHPDLFPLWICFCTFSWACSACGPSICTICEQPSFLNKIRNPGLMSLTFPSFEAPTARISITSWCTCVHKTSAAHLNNACALLFFAASDPNLHQRIINCYRPSSARVFLFADYLWKGERRIFSAGGGRGALECTRIHSPGVINLTINHSTWQKYDAMHVFVHRPQSATLSSIHIFHPLHQIHTLMMARLSFQYCIRRQEKVCCWSWIGLAPMPKMLLICIYSAAAGPSAEKRLKRLRARVKSCRAASSSSSFVINKMIFHAHRSIFPNPNKDFFG